MKGGKAQRPLLSTADAFSYAINASVKVSDGCRFLR